MTLEAGTLSQRVQLMRVIETQDSDGNIVEELVLIAPLWANIRHQTSKEFMAADIERAKSKISIRIRYRPGIKPSMRILHGDSVYNIEGVLPDNESGREYLVLPCSEIVDG